MGLIVWFPLCLLLVWLYWNAVPPGARRLFLLLCSVAFCGFFSPPFTAFFLAQVCIAYQAGRLIRRSARWRTRILQVALVWFVGQLCCFKYTTILMEALPWRGAADPAAGAVAASIVLPIGISYVTFRLIHYLVDLYRDDVPSSSFVDVAHYVLFFPTFLAGPVERFQRFHAQARSLERLDPAGLNDGLYRILKGLIKKTLIADQLSAVVWPIFLEPTAYGRGIVILGVYGMAVRIYLDFSGYTDMAIGVARLFGYRIVENFDAPLLKKNLALFWRSWHISVYTWIRDYFFLPLFGYRASRVKLYVGIVVSMLVFHLWHAASVTFLVLGLYHGIGLVCWQLFQELKRHVPRVRALVERPGFEPLGILLTFNFVSVGLVFLVTDFHTGVRVFERITALL